LLRSCPTRTENTPSPRRQGWPRRLSAEQAERVISLIGAKAGVLVNEEGKPASAHDLRRSFGQRMADAGLPPRDLQAIMRHSSLATTKKFYLRPRAADQAERIAAYLETSEVTATRVKPKRRASTGVEGSSG